MNKGNVPMVVMKRPRVEMVPLIDMFFIILVFFIFGVFPMTMQQGIMVELPAAATSRATREDAITVSVDADDAVFVNHQPVTVTALASRLDAVRPETEKPLVIINADRAAHHGVVVSVLDAIRQAGFARVSFQTAAEPP